MPLSPGDELDPCEILAPIGKGGRGEVYRAHDSRMGRDVAIQTSAAPLARAYLARRKNRRRREPNSKK